MNGYFIALVVLQVLGLGIAMAKHGEPRNEKYSFWTTLVASAISFTLLYFAVKTGF